MIMQPVLATLAPLIGVGLPILLVIAVKRYNTWRIIEEVKTAKQGYRS